MRKSLLEKSNLDGNVWIRAIIPYVVLAWLLAACGYSSEVMDPSPTAEHIRNYELSGESQIEPTVDPSIIPTPRPRRLKPGELILAADIDAIPAILASEDLFVEAEEGDQEWEDDEPVVGLDFNGDERAYPVRLLSLHEIVNDVVGGQPVAVTWCPLCYSSIVFNRVAEREFTFGVSGYLYFNNLVMYDHQSNTMWSQMLGMGIKGAFRGRQLEILPSHLMSWRAWKELHPETRVLSAARLGKSADEVIDPYVSYYTSGAAGITGWKNPDDRLKPKQLVVGIVIGEKARAYSIDAVRDSILIHDELGGQPLLIVYDELSASVSVYLRSLEDRVLTFLPNSQDGVYIDVETGTLWDFHSGYALEGVLEDSSLSRVSAPMVFWFAWSDLYPKTEVFGG
jgi:hypothetical protein